MRIRTFLAIATLLCALGGAFTAALGSTWGGHNGFVRLSFTEGDSLTSDLTLDPDPRGMTVVDLYAVLDGVETVTLDDQAFTAVGGFECLLEIEGVKAAIMSQEFPIRHYNVGQKRGDVRVGYIGELPLVDGRATLVHWQLLLEGEIENVVFRLDPAGARSCDSMPGCTGSGTDADFSGSADQGLQGLIFSAVCVPATLNWHEEPLVEPAPGKPNWRDSDAFSGADGQEGSD